MKKQLLVLLGSLSKTASIAAIVAAAGTLTGKLFWPMFIIVVVVQFVLFYLFNMYMEYKSRNDARLHLFKEAALVGINTVKVICANCKKPNEVAVRMDEENRFICGHCKVKNSVYMSAETAVVTEPLYETDPSTNTGN